MRRFQDFTYPWPAGSTLVLHSDGLSMHWSLDGYPVAGLSGTAAATLAGINESVPAYLHELDGVAASVVSSVNSLHTTGHGLDVVNDVNLEFFDSTGVTAATMRVSA